jgi:hypothetical protein
MIRARLRRQLEEVARAAQAANQVRQKPNQRLVDNGARRRPFLCQTGDRIRQSFYSGMDVRVAEREAISGVLFGL